jgi:hypothetical protein
MQGTVAPPSLVSLFIGSFPGQLPLIFGVVPYVLADGRIYLCGCDRAVFAVPVTVNVCPPGDPCRIQLAQSYPSVLPSANSTVHFAPSAPVVGRLRGRPPLRPLARDAACRAGEGGVAAARLASTRAAWVAVMVAPQD